MYIKITDNIIVSISKINTDGYIYTNTEGLQSGMIVKYIEGENIIAELSEESKKIEMLKLRKQINDEFDNTIDQLEADYGKHEGKFFDMQYREALKVSEGGESLILEGITVEGETVQELSEKIMRNYNAYYSIAVPALQKKRQKLKDLENN